MSQTIKKTTLFHDSENKSVLLFRIPNQTGDYIEVTNYGCRILNMCVHTPGGELQTLITKSISPDQASLDASSFGTLLGGSLGEALAYKTWDVISEGDNYIMLNYQVSKEESPCDSELQVGIRIMWVNLNRLVMDFFISPKEDVSLDFNSSLYMDAAKRDFSVRSFCPLIDEGGQFIPVTDSPFQGMSFVHIGEKSYAFLNVSDDIKPMLELSDAKDNLRISAYSTLKKVSVHVPDGLPAGTVTITNSEDRPVSLKAGETLANRIIYGADYVIEESEDDGLEPDSPFSFFK